MLVRRSTLLHTLMALICRTGLFVRFAARVGYDTETFETIVPIWRIPREHRWYTPHR